MLLARPLFDVRVAAVASGVVAAGAIGIFVPVYEFGSEYLFLLLNIVSMVRA